MSPQKHEAAEAIEIAAEQAVNKGLSYQSAKRRFLKVFFRESLRRHGGNQCATAKDLGVHRNTINRQLKALGISEAR